MYKYHQPKPLEIPLKGVWGFQMRETAAKYSSENFNTKGAEHGSKAQQGYGALAEIVIRNKLGLPEINPSDHPLGYDLTNKNAIKLDVKCRGGVMPFKEEYDSNDGVKREAKHNLFARQIYDSKLDAEIFLLTHLRTAGDGTLPGSPRARSWSLFVCGWVSKERIRREGVYLPRGSMTEQGNTWFAYRGEEIEFFNKNLNGFSDILDINTIEQSDVKTDIQTIGEMNMTTADAIRISTDLVGRGFLEKKHIDFIRKQKGITTNIKPFYHTNQYHHLLEWLKVKGQVSETTVNGFDKTFPLEEFEGL